MTYVDGEALVRYVVFFREGKEVGGNKSTLMMRDKDTIVMETENESKADGGLMVADGWLMVADGGVKVVNTVIAKNNI